MSARTMRRPTLTGDAAMDLPEFREPPKDPLGLLQQWFLDADERAVREPRAVVLATADSTGRPSSRVVDLKTVDADGVVFGTSATSRKAMEIANNKWVSVTAYWRETLQQVRIEGSSQRVTGAESDALWERRLLEAQVATVVSRQGEPLTRDRELEEAVGLVLAEIRASGDIIARPDNWSGYRVVPSAIEFFHGQPSRLHRRLQYVRRSDGGWRVERLQP